MREAEKERRERAEPGPGGRAGSLLLPPPPSHPLFTHTEISDNFTAPFSAAFEKGTDSFLVTQPPSSRSRCYHGKIGTFGTGGGLPLRRATASVQTAAPRNACEIRVFRAHRSD